MTSKYKSDKYRQASSQEFQMGGGVIRNVYFDKNWLIISSKKKFDTADWNGEEEDFSVRIKTSAA